MDQYSRRTIGFGVHAGAVDGVALCRMFNPAIGGHQGMPKYLSSDHDPLFLFEQWRANLRILDVAEIKTVPYVPLSHPFVERVIGTIRMEYLDRTLFWTRVDLEDKLLEFRNYYNRHRTHTSLEGPTPDQDTSVTRRLADWHVSRPSGAFRKRDSFVLDVIGRIGLDTISPWKGVNSSKRFQARLPCLLPRRTASAWRGSSGMAGRCWPRQRISCRHITGWGGGRSGSFWDDCRAKAVFHSCRTKILLGGVGTLTLYKTKLRSESR